MEIPGQEAARYAESPDADIVRVNVREENAGDVLAEIQRRFHLAIPAISERSGVGIRTLEEVKAGRRPGHAALPSLQELRNSLDHAARLRSEAQGQYSAERDELERMALDLERAAAEEESFQRQLSAACRLLGRDYQWGRVFGS
jgi:hypothetical protein